MSSGGFGFFAVGPDGGFVVEGAGLQASAQDADLPVGHAPECVVVFGSAAAEGVVEGADAGRGSQAGLCGRR